jgi:hypothetical protein
MKEFLTRIALSFLGSLFVLFFRERFDLSPEFGPPFRSIGGAFNCASEAFLFFPMVTTFKIHCYIHVFHKVNGGT